MRTADAARATGVEGVADRVKTGELKALRAAVRDGVVATAACDNNPAEQTIRIAKLRIKVSGSRRTLLGAQDFAAIRTYLATTDRHGQNMLDVLGQAMRSRPWTPTA
ncbi:MULTISPECIES: hypothetical protein [Streptomyces]|uniref:hypothetical protein n=1 Tax=Streptomyces TaxID=1883 RepID=UPI001C2F609E|nr:hypothetical protein [Streptomyces sp. GbtcB7]